MSPIGSAEDQMPKRAEGKAAQLGVRTQTRWLRAEAEADFLFFSSSTLSRPRFTAWLPES